MKARRFAEDGLQMQVADYLDAKKVLWTHVANERKSSPQAGKRLKRKGVKAGVPDVLVFKANDQHIGLAIELKVGSNKPTKTQEEWLDGLKNEGWRVSVCTSFDDARLMIDDYLR